nr:TPA_asm: hypothetical protein HUJ06_000656 [Nelumbo nucifera]
MGIRAELIIHSLSPYRSGITVNPIPAPVSAKATSGSAPNPIGYHFEQNSFCLCELFDVVPLACEAVVIASTTCFFSFQLVYITILVHGLSHRCFSRLSPIHRFFPLSSNVRFSLLRHCYNLTDHHRNLSKTVFSPVLHSCTDLKTLKQVHALILCTGFQPISSAPKLITLYTQFDDIKSAVSVFRSLPEANTFTWNSIVKAHVDFGLFNDALFLYREMRELGVSHDNFTFPVIHRAISSLGGLLDYGKMVHKLAIQMGFDLDIYFCNTVIEMYIRCGSVFSARRVFDEMSHRDLVSWTSMICGYVWSRDIVSCFQLFREMQMRELEPNSVTLMIMLQACSLSENATKGRELHAYVIRKGLESKGSLQNSILTMYAKMGNIKNAENLFCMTNKRDIISWNIMISGYSKKGDVTKVAEIFSKMQIEVNPSLETLSLVISAFAKCGNLLQGEMICGYAVKTGLCDIVLQTAIVDLYAKCGELDISAQLFKETSQKNRITWSAMMSGFVQNGYFKEAIELSQQMQIVGLNLEPDILRNLVLVYTHLGALQLGKGVHGYMVRNMFYISREDSAPMETSILNMYAKCGSIVWARRCFDQMVVKDVVAWSSMIEAYGTHGLGFEALKLFDQMEREGVKPNSVTFLSLLSACSHSGLVSEGCRVFGYMRQRYNIEPDVYHYTCMVDLLGRSGKLQEALSIIVNMVVKPDSRIWGALLAASRVYSDDKIGAYVAQRILELEPDNAGYHTLLSNVHASVQRWTEVETIRRAMTEKYLKKKPGWSCIEAGDLHGFVANDGSCLRVVEM